MKFNFDNDCLVEEDLVLKEDSLDQCRSDANSICKMLDRSNIWYELVDYDMYPMNTSKISFEVSGDWKHDHWAFKDILNDWAEENDRDIFKIDEEEIGESDSDDYVARYDVFITADKDSYNKLNSMRGLFAEGLNPREKQIYVDAVNEAEDIEDLEDICHEIYFYDKRLFAQINKKPKDGDVEKMRANMLKYLQESIKESKMFGYNYRYDIVWYNKEGKRINFGFTNDINDAENIAIRACKHIYGMSPSNDRVQFLDSLDIEDTDNKNSSAITSRVVDVKEKFLSKLENKNESLDESRALNYVVEPHKIDMGVYDIVFCNDHPHAGERAHSKRFDSYDDALNFIKRNARYNNWVASPMNEDTVKTKDGKWVNKGDEGTHGKFDTKKEADAQRKAMFANGYHESLEEDSDDNLKKLLNDYFRHNLAGSQTWADVEGIDKIDDSTYKVDVRFKEEFRFDAKDTDGIPYTEYEDSETYTTYKVRIENGKIVSVSNMMNESLKEDFSDFNLINYNDFLANNFDGWSDDIDDLMKEISKCARALKTVSNKLIFYVDYDEDFYAVDNIAKVVEYIGYDYSLYQLNDLSGIYFVFGSDNLWIFRNEKEANYVISKVKAAAKEMNESLQAKLDEGLLDSLEDFKEARKNWKKIVKDISFDVALERWNKESDLADPDWFAKPIYSVQAWNDMVNMFTQDLPEVEDKTEEAPIEEDLNYDPDKLPDLEDIDKMEWKVDEEDGSEYIKIDEINKSVYVALGDNGYYTFLYDGNSNSITPLDDYVGSEEDAKASAKEFLKDYVEGFY